MPGSSPRRLLPRPSAGHVRDSRPHAHLFVVIVFFSIFYFRFFPCACLDLNILNVDAGSFWTKLHLSFTVSSPFSVPDNLGTNHSPRSLTAGLRAALTLQGFGKAVWP